MNFDETPEMPKFLKHLIFATFGISGLTLMLRGSHEADYTDSLLLLAGGIFSTFAIYGLASIQKDIRDSKTWKELIKKIKSQFNDDRRNSK